MSNEERSKFTAFLNPKANSENRLPNMTGQFALAGGLPFSFSAWAARSTKGGLYMKGTHTPLNLTAALTAQIGKQAPPAAGPEVIDLKPGELILFESQKKDDKASSEKIDGEAKPAKRPDWFGYAHTHDGWYQLAGWVQGAESKPGFIAGTSTRFEGRKVDATGEAAAPATRSQRKTNAKLVPDN